jgi:cytochrome o ubiquinol oxidase subunit II
MGTLFKALFFLLLAAAAAFFVGRLVQDVNIPVLNPSGIIAEQQRDLLITATLLMLIVIIPVFIMVFAFAWRYRAENTKAAYTPDWDHNKAAEAVWWGIPCLIILVLAVITWKSSHSLDPYKSLAADNEQMTIQVVALPWRWLFIYPDHNIATVNYVQFPVDKAVKFEITADAPMNSFWIPQLGGQVYAMAGMVTKLHLRADKTGEFAGSSANLSGEGFAGMKFTAKASTESEFLAWVEQTKQSTSALNKSAYNELAKPSSESAVQYFGSVDDQLSHHIVMKYMAPGTALEGFDPAHIRHNFEPPSNLALPQHSH